jgi:hypothetical protein
MSGLFFEGQSVFHKGQAVWSRLEGAFAFIRRETHQEGELLADGRHGIFDRLDVGCGYLCGDIFIRQGCFV